jgi:hypothetical protein
MAADTLVSVGVVLAGVAIDSLTGCSVCQMNYLAHANRMDEVSDVSLSLVAS